MTATHSNVETILALDLSMNLTGYAILQSDVNKVKLIKKGSIKGTSKESHGQRLKRQYDVLKFLREKYPDAVIVKESLHYGRAKTSSILAKVHGMVDLLFYNETIHEYPAVTIKKEVALNGKAKKEEVAVAVIEHLSKYDIVDITFKTDDESDAVAVALTYLKDIVR